MIRDHRLKQGRPTQHAVDDTDRHEAVAGSPDLRAWALARAHVAIRPNDETAAERLHALVSASVEGIARIAPHQDMANAPAAVWDAARLLDQGEDTSAEILLRRHLLGRPQDAQALRLMAEIAARCGFFDDAKRIARKGLQSDPHSVGLRLTLARIHFYHGAQDETERSYALALVDEALSLDRANRGALGLKATFLAHLKRQEEALDAFRKALAVDPTNVAAWVTTGNIFKTLGPVGEAVAAFRTALAIDPTITRAWWELANLKTIKLSAPDARRMERILADDPGMDASDRAELHFSLFKAYDDCRIPESAARHLELGNALKRQLQPYDGTRVTRDVDRSIRTYTPAFFEHRQGWGSASGDLIFIVGMYRAGSTLVEQILSSHSRVEGTEELFYVLEMALGIEAATPGVAVEDFLSGASPQQVKGLASKLLDLSRTHRRTAKALFIDKNPSNWRYLGLLRTLLPNARFIDVRRNPLDCGFANYAQHYHTGVAFSYDQKDIAHYYADYVRLMRHFAPILPKHYHLLIYEDLVNDPEPEIRRLLAFLGLDFEDSCLRFFETERPVYTPSAQQVRQPINRSGIGRWRAYERWLQPLVEELGDLPNNYRD